MMEITLRPMIENKMLDEHYYQHFNELHLEQVSLEIERLRLAKYADGKRVFSGVSIVSYVWNDTTKENPDHTEIFVIEFKD